MASLGSLLFLRQGVNSTSTLLLGSVGHRVRPPGQAAFDHYDRDSDGMLTSTQLVEATGSGETGGVKHG